MRISGQAHRLTPLRVVSLWKEFTAEPCCWLVSVQYILPSKLQHQSPGKPALMSPRQSPHQASGKSLCAGNHETAAKKQRLLACNQLLACPKHRLLP